MPISSEVSCFLESPSPVGACCAFGPGLGFLLYRFHIPLRSVLGAKQADPPQSDHDAGRHSQPWTDRLDTVAPRIEPLITAHHCRIFSPGGLAEKIDPFESLASGIISQQVSGAAAKAIKARFVDLFDHAAAADATTTTATNKFPTPSQVAAASIDGLRSAGLSQRKAEYIQGLAAKFADGELTARWLADAPYEEVLEKLIAVRGLGRWSVEMFACFGLKRMDVFSTGDLGVQRGMAAFAGRDVSKLKAKGGGNKWKYMSEKEMIDMAAPFSPYRSLFMWYMWRVEETDISTLE